MIDLQYKTILIIVLTELLIKYNYFSNTSGIALEFILNIILFKICKNLFTVCNFKDIRLKLKTASFVIVEVIKVGFNLTHCEFWPCPDADQSHKHTVAF